MKTGVELIAEERKRQLKELGYTMEHDEKCNRDNQLAKAAACYAGIPTLSIAYRTGHMSPKLWPFSGDAWKPTPDNRVRELTKAGALIAAEIDRLQRKEETYKIGDRFKIKNVGGEYLLSTADGGGSCVLINLENGVRWRESVKVESPFRITKEEMERITGLHTFSKIQSQ